MSSSDEEIPLKKTKDILKEIIGKKIISYSLWGKGEIYNYGMLENALIAGHFYPDWTIRVYYSSKEDCIEKIIDHLEKLPNVELVEMGVREGCLGSLWRFIPAFEKDLGILMVRDADSRIGGWREIEVLNLWLNSEKEFCIIRDGDTHNNIKILGGMWGCRGDVIKHLKNDFKKFFIKNFLDGEDLYGVDRGEMKRFGDEGGRGKWFGYDQLFLERIIYPDVVDKSFICVSEDIERRMNFKGEERYIYKPVLLRGDFIGAIVDTGRFVCKYLGEDNRRFIKD